MAKERGNITLCLSKTRHHIASHKVRLMVASGNLTVEGVSSRFQLVDDNLKAAEQKLQEIRAAAEKGDCAAVLKHLNEKIEYGHNL